MREGIFESGVKAINPKITLDNRLSAAAQFVRPGAVFADIGTDHAYLPVYLLLAGKIARAYVTDVHAAPLRRAETNIKRYGLADKIACFCCDGFAALKDREFTDAAICGMGGELICAIFGAAPFIHKKGMRLILQPMSHPEKVREYLLAHGFDITGEQLALVDGKLYACICADYDGGVRRYSDLELELGRRNILFNESQLFCRLLEKKIAAQKKIISGKRRANLDVAADEVRLSDYLRLHESRRKNPAEKQGDSAL